MENRRASSTCFGFDFQTNAAIVLFIRNIKELNSLKLEGNFEDIEIKLNDSNYILAQAKSIVHGSYDFKNVRRNLKKALITLSEAQNKCNSKSLILITNSFNPLNDDISYPIFNKFAFRSYSSLPPSSKEIIDKIILENKINIDLNKFYIQVFPFETDDDEERYKYVLEKTNNFISDLKINETGIAPQILKIWQNDIFKNSSKKDASIKLSKKDLIWPILVIITDIDKYDNDEIDIGDYDDIVNSYRKIIDNYCERFELFTKILSDYSVYKTETKGSKKATEFINSCWKNYINEFSTIYIDADLKEALIKIILHNVLRRKRDIDRIKKEVNL